MPAEGRGDARQRRDPAQGVQVMAQVIVAGDPLRGLMRGGVGQDVIGGQQDLIDAQADLPRAML
jgi:hypothetical protein